MITTGEEGKSDSLCNSLLLMVLSETHKITSLLLLLVVFKRLVFTTEYLPDLRRRLNFKGGIGFER